MTRERCLNSVKVLQSARNFNPIPKTVSVYHLGALIFSGNHHVLAARVWMLLDSLFAAAVLPYGCHNCGRGLAKLLTLSLTTGTKGGFHHAFQANVNLAPVFTK